MEIAKSKRLGGCGRERFEAMRDVEEGVERDWDAIWVRFEDLWGM